MGIADERTQTIEANAAADLMAEGQQVRKGLRARLFPNLQHGPTCRTPTAFAGPVFAGAGRVDRGEAPAMSLIDRRKDVSLRIEQIYHPTARNVIPQPIVVNQTRFVNRPIAVFEPRPQHGRQV